MMLDIIAATDAFNAARGTAYTASAVTRWCEKGQLTTARYTVGIGEDGRPRAKWEIDRDELLAFTPPQRGRRREKMEYWIDVDPDAPTFATPQAALDDWMRDHDTRPSVVWYTKENGDQGCIPIEDFVTD